MAGKVSHPYYPLDLVLDNYVPNNKSMNETLTIVFSTFGLIIIGALALAHRKRNSTLRSFSSRSTFLWFTTCGFTHFFLEGYWGINHATIASDQTVFGQVWKEYSISDSRYLSNDSFIVIMENITAFAWGPLSFYTAYAMYNNKPSRYITQLIVSLGQLYGCVLYYLTTIFEGSPHCDPHPFYYYFYFVFMNIFWMIVPAILLHNSVKAIYRVMKASLAAEAAGTKNKKSK